MVDETTPSLTDLVNGRHELEMRQKYGDRLCAVDSLMLALMKQGIDISGEIERGMKMYRMEQLRNSRPQTVAGITSDLNELLRPIPDERLFTAEPVVVDGFEDLMLKDGDGKAFVLLMVGKEVRSESERVPTHMVCVHTAPIEVDEEVRYQASDMQLYTEGEIDGLLGNTLAVTGGASNAWEIKQTGWKK